MRVCVDPGYLRSDVVAALHYAFDNRIHTDGSRGFFHPDQFTFGQPVQLSQIYALAHRIAGVQHLEVTLLRRYGDTLSQPLPENDVLITGRTEIIRLDNDPNYPDRGLLRIEAVGGR